MTSFVVLTNSPQISSWFVKCNSERLASGCVQHREKQTKAYSYGIARHKAESGEQGSEKRLLDEGKWPWKRLTWDCQVSVTELGTRGAGLMGRE